LIFDFRFAVAIFESIANRQSQIANGEDMSRSARKGPYVDEKLFRKVSRLNENRAKQPIKTWARACTIIPEFVGHTFEVHNGNKFLKVFVQEDMVGHKLGEFAPTRMFRGHSGRKAAEAAAGAPAPAKT
jgi:small subunit ribosomal protein S19